MAYQTALIFHVKSIHENLPRFGAEANLNVGNFHLVVRGRNRYYNLIPQFTYRKGGKTEYSPVLPDTSDGLGFIGWLPYFNKRWPLAIDKLAFKEYCVANNLRTPDYWTAATGGMERFIVKQRQSSIGQGIRGPFMSFDPDNPSCHLSQNEYFEIFVPGTIAKAWYWEDKLSCLEMLPMPVLTGNGIRSFHQLVLAGVAPPNGPPDRSRVEALARYQGISLDAIVPAGTTLVADFLYTSPLISSSLSNANSNRLSKYRGTGVEQQLAEAGLKLWQGIPESSRPHTLFTVDAIVDPKDRVWFLEMNCNPLTHPDVYPAMLEGLFGPPQLVADPQALPMGPPPGAAWAGPPFPAPPPTAWGPPPLPPSTPPPASGSGLPAPTIAAGQASA